jgi:glycosyltransferase involved in cell wall biosynthesis
MAAEFWRYPVEQFRVLANGVNLTQFAPDPDAGRAFREEFSLDGRPVAMYVGRLCVQKGTDLLLDAWEQLGEETARWQLALAGPIGQFGIDGPSELVDRLDKLGGRYLGTLDEVQIGAAFNACDVFVMPTRHAEMFGMAALEAEACGKPVVASRWGGLTEAVSPESGEFFEPNDAAALAKALSSLLDDPARRAVMGIAARRHAHTYVWSAIAHHAAEIYREVLR